MSWAWSSSRTCVRLRIASNVVVAISCLIFILCGLAVLPYPGVQYDEAMFSAPLYEPRYYFSGVSILHVRIPLMLMSYLGCLKSWGYKAIFAVWSPSVYSLRLPAILIGTATIYLFWVLLRLTIGDRAAIVGTVLLATDSSFLLTTCFDWGPVALQHLLMIGGVLAVVCFHQSHKEKFLGLGFFLFGLALWDKALFSWSLVGLAAATLLVFPRNLWSHVTNRRLLIAGFSLMFGAFPLLWYDVAQRGNTFSANARFSVRDFGAKVEALERTAQGSALFGYIVRDDQPQTRRQPHTAVERSSVAFTSLVGQHQRNLVIPAFLLAALGLPFFWRTHARIPMLFTLILLVVIWLQMAITVGTGTGAHHVILLWPWPMFFIAAAFSQALTWFGRSRGVVLVTLVLVLAGANLLVTNQYLKELVQNGPGSIWDDAIFSLAEYTKGQSGAEIYSVDWGTMNPLRLLDRGTLRLEEAAFVLLKQSPDQQDERFLTHMITTNDGLFVAHTTPFEAFQGINARLENAAEKLGYRRRSIATIYDQEGSAVFDLFRFEKASPNSK